MLAEYCEAHFAEHVPQLRKRLRAKLDTLMEALNEQFGTAAEFDDPQGGIFLWVKLPDNVDTHEAARAGARRPASPSIRGRNGRSTRRTARAAIRLCFASPTHDEIREGIAVLAEVCRKEFGVPARSANVERARGGVTVAAQQGILAIFNDCRARPRGGIRGMVPGRASAGAAGRARLPVRPAAPGDFRLVRLFQFLSGRVSPPC